MPDQGTTEAGESTGLTDRDWEQLLLTIRHKECTPFLGAGACAGVLPLGKDLAAEWAQEYDYPFEDRHNLVRVAQYVAIEAGPRTPKYRIVERFQARGTPNFADPDEPHRVAADLRLPLYITTNYDDFMTQAIQKAGRTPTRELCRWHLARKRSQPLLPDLDPTPDRPLVFHLHGALDNLDSMVLTEDDYLDFLMNISEIPALIPSSVDQALASSSFLFLGYSLEDMNFKVLFRRLASYLHRNETARHFTVQLPLQTGESGEKQADRIAKQRKYLEKDFDLRKVKVYWGDCQKFAKELRARWEAFNRG